MFNIANNNPMHGLSADMNVNNAIYNTGDKPVLYLIPPKNWGTQVRRPLVYNFNDNFIDEAASVCKKALDKGSMYIDAFLNRPDVLSTVVPSATGILTDFRHLSNMWTFIFIVSGDKPRNVAISTGFNTNPTFTNSLMGNRIIYTGFFINDEPINTVNFGTATPTINPNAELIITHKTVINVASVYGNMGRHTRSDVVGDVDVVHGLVANITDTANNQLHFITPDKLHDSVDIAADGKSMLTWGNGSDNVVFSSMSPVPVASANSVPRANLSLIFNSQIETDKNILANSVGNGTLRSGPNDDELYSPADIYHSNMQTHLNSGTSAADHVGLKTNQIVSLAYLDSMYNPIVQPIATPYNSQMGILDQCTNSAVTVYSSLVTQIVPTMLVNRGFGMIAFAYDSYHNKWSWEGYSLLIPADDAATNAKIIAIQQDLMQQIFPILSQRGPFALYATITTGHVSRCILNFYCDNEVNTGAYETPTIAGGILSNMLGDNNIYTHNTSGFSQLVSRLNGMDMGIDDTSMNIINNAQSFHTSHPPLGNMTLPNTNMSNGLHIGNGGIIRP